MRARTAGADAVDDKDSLIDSQYKGKENLRPIYDLLIKSISKFGKDVEISPKKSYVSLRRKKQFALLIPATKKRFEIGINIKGQKSSGILEEINKANSMCSHKIKLTDQKEVNKEVLDWIKKAYEKAG